jgi:hypothetical protein
LEILLGRGNPPLFYTIIIYNNISMAFQGKYLKVIKENSKLSDSKIELTGRTCEARTPYNTNQGGLTWHYEL